MRYTEPIEAESAKPKWTVHVWQLPVRIVHWTIFICVVILSVTGFYIGTPFLATGSDPQFAMGTARAIHSVTAWVMIAAVIARLIWAFTGNQWARWDQFIAVDKERREQGREVLRYYLFLRRDYPDSIGHNALAGTTYTVVYVMFLVQIFTGLALKGLDNPDSLYAYFTGWIFHWLSIPGVRFLHHLIMWLTWGFVVHHIYSATLVDIEAKDGVISSIFGGRKQVTKKQMEEHL